jgi:hypothetical protein
VPLAVARLVSTPLAVTRFKRATDSGTLQFEIFTVLTLIFNNNYYYERATASGTLPFEILQFSLLFLIILI